MAQNNIRNYNGVKFTTQETSDFIDEVKNRTDSAQNGYDSVDALATKVKLLESSERVYNIKKYGVLGDGTDETLAIKNVIQLADSGSTIYFPKGEYAVSESLIIDKQLSIIGEGYSTEIKVYTANTELGLNLGVFTIRANYCSIKNIRVNGNFDISNYGGSNRNSGVYIDKNTESCEISDFYAHNLPRHGMTVLGQNHTLFNINVWETSRHNVSIGDGSNQANATFNILMRNIFCSGGLNDAAVEINDGVHGVILDGFVFEGVFGESPMRVVTHDRPNESISNIFISNGIIETTGSSGILITSNGDVNTVDNVNIKDVAVNCAGHGIELGTNLSNISFENIAIQADNYPIRAMFSSLKNIKFKNINIKNWTSGMINFLGTDTQLLSGIEIDGLFAESISTASALIQVSYGEGIVLKNIVLKSDAKYSSDFIQLLNCEKSLIENVDFLNGNNRFIVVFDSSNVRIDKANLDNCTGNAIHISNSSQVFLDGVVASINSFGLYAQNSTRLDVINSDFTGATSTSGCEIITCDYLNFQSNKIHTNGRHGIRLLESTFINILANKIYNNSQTGTGVGLQIRTQSGVVDTVFINQNQIFDNQSPTTQDAAIDYRLDTGGSSSNFNITNNVLQDGILNAANLPVNSFISNNVGHDTEATGSYTTADGKTVTVTNGLVTSIV